MKDIKSELKVKASDNIDIVEELRIPDPDPYVARAMLQEILDSEDNKDEDSQGDD